MELCTGPSVPSTDTLAGITVVPLLLQCFSRDETQKQSIFSIQLFPGIFLVVFSCSGGPWLQTLMVLGTRYFSTWY